MQELVARRLSNALLEPQVGEDVFQTLYAAGPEPGSLFGAGLPASARALQNELQGIGQIRRVKRNTDAHVGKHLHEGWSGLLPALSADAEQLPEDLLHPPPWVG